MMLSISSFYGFDLDCKVQFINLSDEAATKLAILVRRVQFLSPIYIVLGCLGVCSLRAKFA